MEKAGEIATWLEEHKAADVVLLDLADRSTFTEAMVIATATSVRHAQSLADGVNGLCGERNFEFLRMDGYQVGQWILVDCNDFVVNIFQPETRDLYKLESLWSVPASREELASMAASAGTDGPGTTSSGE